MTQRSIPPSIAETLKIALTQGDKAASVKATQEALSQGIPPMMIIQELVVPVLTEVGRLFENLDIFLPELMAAGEAGNACTSLIEEEIMKSGKQMQVNGVVVVGTVKGDIHDIGKNIVVSLLKAQGFRVIDLGKDVPAATFIDSAEANNADIIAASALMSITRAGCRDVAVLLKDRGLNEKYLFIVGGGSITNEYAIEIGADGFSEIGSGAVELAKTLMAKKKGA